MNTLTRYLAPLGVSAFLAACHGGGGGGAGASAMYTVGGTVVGLAGNGLVLQNNAGNNLTVAAGGTFVFSTLLASGTAYSITVRTQPTNPSQTCTMTNGSGSVAGANVTTPQVSCTTNSFTVGGTVTGLDALGLVQHRGRSGDRGQWRVRVLLQRAERRGLRGHDQSPARHRSPQTDALPFLMLPLKHVESAPATISPTCSRLTEAAQRRARGRRSPGRALRG